MSDQHISQPSERRAILSRYISNPDGDVFVLTNLPDVVKGTLFSRYSRSSKSLKDLLLTEFLKDLDTTNTDQSNFAGVDLKKAEKFYERVLIQYGDDSVGELAGVHLALENISNLATKFIEDRRIGLSPLEKSSRYVYFNEKVNGEYRYYRPPEILESPLAEDYISTMNLLFDTYSDLMKPMEDYFKSKFPKPDDVSDRAYNSSIRAKVCDSLRGLLPASTLTNMGLYGNGRAFDYLLTLMRASNLREIQDLATKMHTELSKVIPVFVRKSFGKYGDQWVEYLKSIKTPKLKTDSSKEFNKPYTKLVDYDEDAYDKIISAILFTANSLDWDSIQNIVASMDSNKKIEIIRDYIGDRTNRRHKPGRAFEHVYYTFEVLGNFGAYRDLQRHRILTQERQLLSTFNGYDMPAYLEEAGVADRFHSAMREADLLYRKLLSISPEVAQYAVPFAYRVRWYMKLNLREAYHLIELRSSRQGHPDYRRIAQSMYYQIKEVHPILAEGMKFVDLNDYDLERLDAEKRIDSKLNKFDRDNSSS